MDQNVVGFVVGISETKSVLENGLRNVVGPTVV